MPTPYEKLSTLLKELFQMDQADLDFGIYRIMNQKREEISRFMDRDLLPQVRAAFEQYRPADKSALEAELQKAIQGAQGLGVDPDLVPKVKELREQIASYSVDIPALENEVYSHLYSFFRRYYDEGDFISMRRYKEGVYAIPYEGEEVKLHWANADQYYVKTSENFRDYSFRLPSGRLAHFKIVDADVEKDNVKAVDEKDRRFILAAENAVVEEDEALVMRFEYRADAEKRDQKALMALAAEAILLAAPAEWQADLRTLAATESNPTRILLEKHLADYSARNSFDYFIHKDLGSFLRRELDFYIKNEIMRLDDIENEDAPRVEQYLSKIKALRMIAHKIIAFLAQIEDFQKKLWLKKKFVVETNYCITLDRVPEELYPEICANDAQREEWVRLFAIDDIAAQHPAQPELGATPKPGYSVPLTIEFLKANPFLVLDTKFFESKFNNNLFADLDSIDDQLDGLLIHSENFQALSLIAPKYAQQAKCIYIDPPYNTDGDGFTYKDSFRNSSWLSMMYDRLNLGKVLSSRDGVLFISIGNEEVANLKTLTTDIYGDKNEHNVIHWKKNQKPQNASQTLSESAEYILVFFNENPIKLVRPMYGTRQDERGSFKPTPLFKFDGRERRVQVIPIGTVVEANMWKKGILKGARNKLAFIEILDEPVIVNGLLQNDVHVNGEWCKTESNGAYQEVVRDKRLFINSNGFPNEKAYRDNNSFNVQTNLWLEAGYNELGKQTLDSIFGISGVASYPKPVELLQEIIKSIGDDKALILDYFSGSGTTGHAVIDLNREDDGARRYIMVEMGNSFNTVNKPRIQKVIYSKDWNEGKPVSREGSSHCFKYLRLESYEDALNNLAVARTQNQQLALEANAQFNEDYMLSYMLDVESQGALLNIQSFAHPFDYRLNIATGAVGESQPTRIDLVETFNYLIGLHVETTQVLRGFHVVTGRTPGGERTLIIWRDLGEKSNADLEEFFRKQDYNPRDMEFDLIYVNGDNNLENIRRTDETWKVRLIEEDFLRLMWETDN